jgi:hypothetical protein
MTTTKRAPNSVIVPKIAIEQATLALEALPEKPKERWSLREAVEHMQTSITAALEKGYTYDEVASMLSKQGVEIRASSLKRYLATAKKDDDAPAKPRGRRPRQAKTAAETIESVTATIAASSGVVTPAALPEETPISASDHAAEPEAAVNSSPTTPSEEVVEAAPTPKRRGRAASGTSSKTAAKAKTTAKTSPRPTTRGKAKDQAKPASTRGRKKGSSAANSEAP